VVSDNIPEMHAALVVVLCLELRQDFYLNDARSVLKWNKMSSLEICQNMNRKSYFVNEMQQVV